MDRVEVIFERIGFDLGQPREARTDRDGKISSAFETGKHQGFAVGCSFRPRDGYLEVVFVERNSSFSESGQKLLQQLRTELHREFGLQQIEVSPPAKDPAPTSPAG